MTLEYLQKSIDEWIHEIGNGYFPPLANMVVLSEEVGELARVMVRKYGPQIAKPGDLDKDIEEELADVLWVIGCLANQTGVDLSVAFSKAMKKKSERDRFRFKPDNKPDNNDLNQ